MENEYINWQAIRKSIADRIFSLQYHKQLNLTERRKLAQDCIADIDRILDFHKHLDSETMLAYHRNGGKTLTYSDLIGISMDRVELVDWQKEYDTKACTKLPDNKVTPFQKRGHFIAFDMPLKQIDQNQVAAENNIIIGNLGNLL